jgi:hypothetical protein
MAGVFRAENSSRFEESPVAVRSKQDTVRANQDTVRSKRDSAYFAEPQRSEGVAKYALATFSGGMLGLLKKIPTIERTPRGALCS